MLVVEPPKPLPRYKIARIEPPSLKPRTKNTKPLPPPKPSNIEETTANELTSHSGRTSALESCSTISSFDDDIISYNNTSFDESSSIYETSLISLISTKIETTPTLPVRKFSQTSATSSEDEVSYDTKRKPPEIVAVIPKIQPKINEQLLTFDTFNRKRGFGIGCSMLSSDDFDKNSINSSNSDRNLDSVSLYSTNPDELSTEDLDEDLFKVSKNVSNNRNPVQNELLGIFEMNAVKAREELDNEDLHKVSGEVGSSSGVATKLVVGDPSDKGM